MLTPTLYLGVVEVCDMSTVSTLDLTVAIVSVRETNTQTVSTGDPDVTTAYTA